MVEAIQDKLDTVRTFVWIEEEGSEACAHTIPFSDEYESLLARSASSYAFPDFDENTRATTFYTTDTTGLPKGVYNGTLVGGIVGVLLHAATLLVSR